MIRPPALQLRYDNRFPQPLVTPSVPKGPSFVAQLYKASWKNPIIALAGLNGLRYAFAVYNALEDAIVDDEEGADNLLKVSVALCVMYMLSFFIEVYGIIGVSMQRLGFIRAYMYLALAASLLITAAGVLKGVTYFTLAEELMIECITLATEGRGYRKSRFRAGPWPSSMAPYPQRLAKKQCLRAWVHHSWSEVAAVFIFSVIPSVIYYVLVYTYYRQTTDPTHHANLLDNHHRSPVVARRRGGGRAGAAGGYRRVDTTDREYGVLSSGVSATGMTTGRLVPATTPRQRRAAQAAPYTQRAGVSQNMSMATSGHVMLTASTAASTTSQTKRKYVPRSLKRDRRPPPLMQSPSPIGLGPAEYGNANAGRSRVYAAFAAPIEYDKFV